MYQGGNGKLRKTLSWIKYSKVRTLSDSSRISNVGSAMLKKCRKKLLHKQLLAINLDSRKIKGRQEDDEFKRLRGPECLGNSEWKSIAGSRDEDIGGSQNEL